MQMLEGTRKAIKYSIITAIVVLPLGIGIGIGGTVLAYHNSGKTLAAHLYARFKRSDSASLDDTLQNNLQNNFQNMLTPTYTVGSKLAPYIDTSKTKPVTPQYSHPLQNPVPPKYSLPSQISKPALEKPKTHSHKSKRVSEQYTPIPESNNPQQTDTIPAEDITTDTLSDTTNNTE
jgi:hypothetical protein